MTLNLRRTVTAAVLAAAAVTAAPAGLNAVNAAAPAAPAPITTTTAPAPAAPLDLGAPDLTGTVVDGEVTLAGTTGLSITSTLQAPFALLSGLAGSAPRWNPCETVQWRFNPAGAPVGGFGVVGNALKRISAVSGLRFQYMGTTSTVPGSAYLNQSYGNYKPLLIGWSNSTTGSDLLRGAPATRVGEARVKWVGWSLLDGATSQLATGVVAFNRATRAPLYGANSRYTFALHELGHAVGLNHVSSSSNLMNPVIPSRMSDLGTGDRAGLTRVGASSGCMRPLR